MLGEVVSGRGWLALLAGFAGVLVVVRPGIGGFHPAALLVLASASFWCLSMLTTRRLVGIDSSTVTLLWTAVTGLVVLLALLPFFAQPLTAAQALFCVAVGVVASAGQWLALLAYRYARATVLAPLTYGQLIWSATLGYLVFGNAPRSLGAGRRGHHRRQRPSPSCTWSGCGPPALRGPPDRRQASRSSGRR